MDRLADFAARYAEVWSSLVWHAAWQGTVIGLAALAVVALGRRWPSPVRYWILLLALIKFVTPPLMTFPTGVFSLVSVTGSSVEQEVREKHVAARDLTDPESDNSAARDPALLETEIRGESRRAADGVATRGDSNDPADRRPKTTDMREAASISTPPPVIRLSVLLSRVHLAGTGLVLVIFIFRVLRLQDSWRWFLHPDLELSDTTWRIARRLGLRRVPAVRLSRATHVPYSAGIIRPVVILPAEHARELSPDDLHAVLAHELAHHRRGDLFINLLQVGIEAAWWFHPVVWLLNRTIRSVREECCDDLLLSQRIVDDESYCATLLRVAQTCSRRRFAAPVSVSVADGLHPLSNRIRRIMDDSLPRRARTGVPAVVTLGLLAAIVLPGVRAVPARAVDGHAVGRAAPPAEPRNSESDSVAPRPIEEPRPRKDVRVFGRVTDEQGRPVEGAAVAVGQYFNNFEFPSTTKTRPDGTYRLDHCPEGESLLTVVKVGLAPCMRTVAVKKDKAEFDVTLPPGRLVRIRLTDKRNEPVAGVQVSPFKWPDTSTLTKLHNFGKTDANGVWTWDWAPEQPLPYTARKAGSMTRLPDAALAPGTELHEWKLLPELQAKVRVVDDATGRPVSAFRVAFNLNSANSAPEEHWSPPQSVESPDGEYTVRQGETPWDEYAVRVDADGYLPVKSRTIRADEENVVIDIRLRAARQRKAVALNADGTPSAGAAVLLGTVAHSLQIRDLQPGLSSQGRVGRTDRAGGLHLDAVDEDFTVFVVGQSGFAHIPRRDFKDRADGPQRIALKPWGRIEGTVRSGRDALANQPVTLSFRIPFPGGDRPAPIVGLGDGSSVEVRTDRNGRFTFDHVPPGIDVWVGDLVTVATPRGPMLGHRQAAYFQVAAGDVRQITLGGSGRSVIGRFQMKDEAWAVDWEASFGQFEPTTKPGEVDVLYRPYPRFQIQKGGSFHLAEIPPGKYKLAFQRLALGPESSLKRNELPGFFVGDVTVPELAAGDADRPVDLGTLPVGFITGPPPK